MTPLKKFRDFIDEYYLPYAWQRVELSTYQNYNISLKLICEYIGNDRIGFITKKTMLDLLEKLNKRGLAQNTIHGYFKLLNAIFNFAVKNKNITQNPCKGIWVKEVNSRAGAFTVEEVKTLLGYIKSKLPLIYLPVYLSVNTGMRRGEVLGLKWEHIDFVKKEISVLQSLCRTSECDVYIKSPKTAAGLRKIAISDDVAEILKFEKEKGKSEYVVSGWNGGYMDPQYLTNHFSKAVKGAGVSKKRFHDLRHTHASILLAAGVSIKLISERLGHGSIDITLKVYSHMLPNMQHEAAERFSSIIKIDE